MTEFVTHTLLSPVKHGELTITELTFREAEVGDFMAADHIKGEFSGNVAVLASISDTPLPAFKKIKAKDFSIILAKTKDLLGNEAKNTTGE
ncbi:phage tail assembly protein [Rhizobium sp. No.120]